MRRLGTVLHVSSHGYIIVKAELFPRLNSTVLTKRMKKIGTVYDVFGPVKAPYVSIKPFASVINSDSREIRGAKVYV